MAPYFGSKWKLTRDGKYPEPQCDIIIEPFAGFAGYSLNYHWKQVVLVEKNPRVVGVLKYLQNIDESFQDLPDTVTDVPDYLEPVQQDTIGFWLARGITAPRPRMSQWANKDPDQFWSSRVKRVLAAQSPYIRHWQICKGDHESLPDVEATWFIDPPYQRLPGVYPFSDIDYPRLRDWVLSRRGQVIVCEGGDADWLPFVPLAPGRTKTGRPSGETGLSEVWWYRSK